MLNQLACSWECCVPYRMGRLKEGLLDSDPTGKACPRTVRTTVQDTLWRLLSCVWWIFRSFNLFRSLSHYLHNIIISFTFSHVMPCFFIFSILYFEVTAGAPASCNLAPWEFFNFDLRIEKLSICKLHVVIVSVPVRVWKTEGAEDTKRQKAETFGTGMSLHTRAVSPTNTHLEFLERMVNCRTEVTTQICWRQYWRSNQGGTYFYIISEFS